MTKQEMEREIINGIKSLGKSSYGDYHYFENLHKIISKVMGYEIVMMPCNRPLFKEILKISEIEIRMQAKGVIRASKNGNMFKLIG